MREARIKLARRSRFNAFRRFRESVLLASEARQGSRVTSDAQSRRPQPTSRTNPQRDLGERQSMRNKIYALRREQFFVSEKSLPSFVLFEFRSLGFMRTPDEKDVCSSFGLNWRSMLYFQRNHSMFLNYSAFRGISSFTPTEYGAIACTIGSRNNSPETASARAREHPQITETRPNRIDFQALLPPHNVERILRLRCG